MIKISRVTQCLRPGTQNGIQAKTAAPPVCGNVVGVMYPQAQEMAGTAKAVMKIEVIAQINISVLKRIVHQAIG